MPTSLSRPLLVLRVMGRPPDLHQQGQHRMAKADVIRERRAMVKVLAQGERHRARMAANVLCGDPQHRHNGPCSQYRSKLAAKRRLHVTLWWHGTRRDSPNMLQDLKADIDGLVDAGWLVNDNDDWLVLDYPPEYIGALTKRDVSVEYRLYEVSDEVH